MMNVWDMRVALAEMRFSTDLRMSSWGWGKGNCGVGIWAKSFYWGDLIAETCFHEHVKLSLSDDASAYEAAIHKAMASVFETVQRARREFPDRVPCQVPDRLPDGRIGIVFSSYTDAREREGRERLGYDASHFPPIDWALLPKESGGESYAREVAQLSHLGLTDGDLEVDWEDFLNPYAEPRYVRDTRPKVWQYQASPRVRKFRDRQISAVGQPQASVGAPNGVGASHCARDMMRRIRNGFSASALPEGYKFYEVS